MRLAVKSFGGMVPRVSARLLDASAATIAQNCRLNSGALEPWADLAAESSGPWRSGVKRSIYKWGDDWFHWLAAGVDVVRSPIADNVNDRVVFTGDGVPKITDDGIAPGSYLPNATYPLGIAVPTSTISVSAGAVPAESEAYEKRGRNYVFTYVSAWGEEGPPSEASETLEVVDGQPVTLGGLAALPGSYAGPGTKRIYRANSGTQSTEIQFVAEIPMAQTGYVDTVAGADLGEALQSLNFDPPPSDLAGLTIMPNGMLVGFSGNDLCFSEPYQPHAWPTDYRLHTDYPIVALGVTGNTVVVSTERDVYLATGVDPTAMSLSKKGQKQPCVSKRGMVETPAGVLYPSPDGLVLATEGGVQVVSKGILDRDDWQAYQPETLYAAYHDGRWFGFYDDGLSPGCLILDADTGNFSVSDVHCDASYTDPQADALYLMRGDELVRWDRGAGTLTASWRSRQYELPRPSNFAWAHVVADAYPVTFRVYTDTALIHTETVADDRPFTLPGGFLARAWQMEVDTEVRVHNMAMAQSVEELRAA